MKVILLILIAVAAVHSSKIQCSKRLCELICKNAPTQETCAQLGKEYRPNSSLCGCCATCIDYIPPFGECNREVSLPIHGGFPVIKRHCHPRHICFNHKCVIPPVI